MRNGRDRCCSWITLDLYIFLVPSLGPLQSGNAWLDIVTRELAGETVKLPRYKKPARFRPLSSSHATTRSPRDSASVSLVLPGELAKHAVYEGTKAVTKFMLGCLVRYNDGALL